ncbi:spore germination protein [Bacillus cereus]
MEGITNEQFVNTAIQRLEDIDFDVPFDSTMIEQFISDNSNSPFPVLLPTERLDRAVFALINGEVLILTDGSPYALSGPTTLLDFFHFTRRLLFTVDDWIVLSYYSFFSELYFLFFPPLFIQRL